MQWDVFHIDAIAKELNKKLEGKILRQCFSTSREDLFLLFDADTALKLSFYKGRCYFHFPEIDKLPKKNRLNQFPELINVQLEKVWAYPLDRAFCIDFKPNLKLCFYLFGRFSQLSLYSEENYIANFPKSAKIIEQRLQPSAIEAPRTVEEAQSKYHWLKDSDIDELEQEKYDKSSNQLPLWLSVIDNHKTLNWGIKTHGKYELCHWNKDCISHYDNILDAVQDISSLIISKDAFESAKKGLLAKQIQKIALLNKRKKSVLANLKAVERALGFKEKADLLMANMHLVEKGQQIIHLKSFDGLTDIEIKLDPAKSVQEVAEKFYKKAKNEKLRTTYLNSSLEELNNSLQRAEQELQELKALETMRDLKPYLKQTADGSSKERIPYKRFNIDGYEVRVGKSAKDNDELLRAHSSPQDLWFHAKSVGGSHVILRLNKNQQASDLLIENVAAIAAYYSKSKNEKLARVIYTYRKFVRKPKKAAPGAVIVEKEKSILVKPALEF